MRNFDEKILHEILDAGNQAPSADNCQPWFFVLKNGHIELHHDLKNTHSNELYNLEYFADYISMGCVLENIRHAAEKFRFEADIELTSHKEYKNGKIADIRLTPLSRPPKSHFFEHIKKRTTNRKHFNKKSIPNQLKELFQETAKESGGRMIFVDNKKDKRKMAKIIALHDKLLWKEEKMRDNLMRMLRTGKHTREDGLSIKSLELGILSHFFSPSIKLAEKISLFWDFLAIGSGQITKGLIKNSGAIGILLMNSENDHYDPSAFIRGGSTFQKIWLQATEKDLYIHPMYGSLALIINKKISKGGFQKKHLWIQEKIFSHFENNFPNNPKEQKVAIFRIGYAKNPSDKSPRKTVHMKIKKSYSST